MPGLKQVLRRSAPFTNITGMSCSISDAMNGSATESTIRSIAAIARATRIEP